MKHNYYNIPNIFLNTSMSYGNALLQTEILTDVEFM